LANIGVLEEDNSSELSSPSFAIPNKYREETLRVVIDFRKLNLSLERHPFPIPKIGEATVIRSIEEFYLASALDLIMGYYHIKLDYDAQNLFTIVFPWIMGKYKYKRLPMGIKIACFLMFFKMSYQSLSKIWNMLRPILMIC
jgi:hypothetical protein